MCLLERETQRESKCTRVRVRVRARLYSTIAIEFFKARIPAQLALGNPDTHRPQIVAQSIATTYVLRLLDQSFAG